MQAVFASLVLRGGHGYATALVEVRRQLARVGSLLPPCRSLELNSGMKFSSKCLFPVEPSC